ncbi:MAG: IclR family transcriptional regulator [Ilumatobacter fluminis]|uniref:IclR family transcriptional regulator n=1 Tax=Ilumatobacter fluminis TaxID=467091 RepID=UPI0032EB2662
MSSDLPAATVGSIERAFEVLTLFAESESPTLGVTEIADRLGYSKAVVHRILATCRKNNFVEFDPNTRRYALGPRFVELGMAYLDRIDVRSRARPVMTRLSEATAETVTLSIRSSWERVYVDQVTPERDVKMVVQLGRSFPLHAGASSKALLAFLPASQQDEYLERSDLGSLTGQTITDRDELVDELERIRECGYAVSLGERDATAGSAAAPVFGPDGRVLAVLSVAGPVDRFSSEVDRLIGLLLEASANLTTAMGGVRPPQSGVAGG